jgi:hypothetical protein
MKKSIFSSLLALTLPFLSANAVTYSLDDGTNTGEIAVGLSEGYFVNAFQAQAGGETIVSLSVAFGPSTDANDPFDIVVISDPNNDQSPLDGVVLATQAVTTPGTITAGAFVS